MEHQSQTQATESSSDQTAESDLAKQASPLLPLEHNEALAGLTITVSHNEKNLTNPITLRRLGRLKPEMIIYGTINNGEQQVLPSRFSYVSQMHELLGILQTFLSTATNKYRCTLMIFTHKFVFGSKI